jgi:hypothetical protein
MGLRKRAGRDLCYGTLLRMATRSTKILSRRDFIKYSALAAAGALIDFHTDYKTALRNHQDQPAEILLGRVFKDGTASFSDPSKDSKQMALHNHNDILSLEDTITKNTGRPVSEIWHRLEDGSFISSQDVQPVKNQLNAPLSKISSSGQLAEITVPFTDGWNSSLNRQKSNQVFFYGSTHWIFGLGEDEQKNAFYLVKEDRWNYSYYVNASHMHVFDDEELLPITELIPLDEKKIVISLQQPVLMAYERNTPVFMSALASGQLAGNNDLTTPQGNFMTTYKRPSRHMVHTDRMGADGNELYGVPWVSYFTDTGIAFHGTYWHNSFTLPRSHGCINLPIPAARWIYRWTQPIVPPREQKYVSRYGTSVEVI